MTYVLKIKFESTLRRVPIRKRYDLTPDLTFKELETKIRDLFQIPPLSELVITYTDQDNEVVTMGEDHDLEDACLVQRINPLRLDVKVTDVKMNVSENAKEKSRGLASVSTELPKMNGEGSAEHASKDNSSELISESVKQMLSDHIPFVKAAIPQETVSEIVDSLLELSKGTVNSYVYSPVDMSRRQPNYHSRSSQSGNSSLENADRVFHKGVQCDLCGMTPIVGPRFKSIRNEDYDLCHSCFTEVGNEADYRRLDRPVHPRRNHYYYPSYGGKMMRHHMVPPIPPLKPLSLRGPFGWKHEYPGRSSSFAKGAGEHYGGKLDARFVRDVSIFDGTEVTYGTNFTKIWRLRNIGSFSWPRLTQLVHVGGDILGSDKPASLELPEEGLPCDEEIDASVDLVAPERPGRYVSHWRLMAPSGQKFGQRVWVLIQVVPKDPESPQRHDSPLSDQFSRPIAVKDSVVCGKSDGTQESLPRSNDLNPSILKKSGPEISLPMQDGVGLVEDNSDVAGSDLGGFSVVERPREVPKNSATEMITVEQPHHRLLSVLNTQVSPEMENVSNVDQQSTDISTSEELSSTGLGQEDTLLEMLNSMGFTHRSLNVELLRKNEGNLQHTIDDLVTASGWDHLLEDLEEMGFYDVEMNRRLLFKNHGKVKLVVKELLEMQRTGGNKDKIL